MKSLINKTLAISMLSISLFGSCSSSKGNSEDTTMQIVNGLIYISEEQAQHIDLQTTTVMRKNQHDHITVLGEIGVPPQNNVEISAITDVQILEITHLVGNHVKKGDVVAYAISPAMLEWQQNYLQNSENYLLAQQEAERQSLLNDKRINASKQYEQALAHVKKLKTEVEMSKSRLQMIGINPKQVSQHSLVKKIAIRAPIEGKISAIMVHKNQFIKGGNALMSIVSTHHLHAELKVFEKSLPQLKEGQQVSIYLPANDTTLDGYVYLISNTLHQDGAYAEVHVHFSDESKLEDLQLRMGQMIEATIYTRTYKAFSVPITSVFMVDGSYYVFSKTETKKHIFKPMPISRGMEKNGFVNIEFLVKPPDTPLEIVHKGAFFLASQTKDLTK